MDTHQKSPPAPAPNQPAQPLLDNFQKPVPTGLESLWKALSGQAPTGGHMHWMKTGTSA